ncbi:MAG: hypothetical protein QNJ88_06545 [Acidimicrobiia bacterium]|nr:hypothetical protein [Acidimicrobiia bacterium]
MSEFAVVGAYGSEMEADLVVQRLAGAGIRATTRRDTVGGMFPSMELATGGVEVLVPEDQLLAARRELDQTPPPPAPSQRRRTPSAETDQAQPIRRLATVGFFIILIVIVLAAMLSFLDSPIP